MESDSSPSSTDLTTETSSVSSGSITDDEESEAGASFLGLGLAAFFELYIKQSQSRNTAIQRTCSPSILSSETTTADVLKGTKAHHQKKSRIEDIWIHMCRRCIFGFQEI